MGKAQASSLVAAIVMERWQMATTKLEDFEGESEPSLVNSDDMEELHDSLRRLTFRMAGGEPSGDNLEDVEAVFTELLLEIESSLKDLASRVERRRKPQVIAA